MAAPNQSYYIHKALRDIEDGHITVMAEAWWFNPYTGEALDTPKVVRVSTDRMPEGYLVWLGKFWVEELAAAGYLVLVKDSFFSPVSFYKVSGEGLREMWKSFPPTFPGGKVE